MSEAHGLLPRLMPRNGAGPEDLRQFHEKSAAVYLRVGWDRPEPSPLSPVVGRP
ncbi:hypothetical protein [Nocardia sp. NRRL S-836]|uniref:hypothetical protein n=1 Tax=Nocardia sp. NRRL S-836 TaxID=1519492 RepID=UPI00350EEB7D